MKIHQVDLRSVQKNEEAGTVSIRDMTVWLVDDQKKPWKEGSEIELSNMPGTIWKIVKIYQAVDEKLVKDSHDSHKVFDSIKKT